MLWSLFLAIPGAKLITTVRSIPTLYESTFGYYFAYVKEYIKAQTLNNFFSNPKDYFHPAEANKLSQYARNTMTHDLGYPAESRDLELRLVFSKIEYSFFIRIGHGRGHFRADIDIIWYGPYHMVYLMDCKWDKSGPLEHRKTYLELDEQMKLRMKSSLRLISFW